MIVKRLVTAGAAFSLTIAGVVGIANAATSPPKLVLTVSSTSRTTGVPLNGSKLSGNVVISLAGAAQGTNFYLDNPSLKGSPKAINTLLFNAAALPPGNHEVEAVATIAGHRWLARAIFQVGASAAVGAEPNATNTGVPKGTALKVVSGDQTFSTNGQVVTGLDVHGKVTITGDNITFKNSIVRGPTGSSCVNGAGIEIKGKSATVQDTEVSLSNPTACLDGISASNATLLRLNVHNSVDGLKLGSNSTLKNSYVHDLHYFTSDPNQGGGATHNDDVQILSGSKILLDSNNFDATSANTNSSVQVTQDFGLVSNLSITNNWMDGGGCSLNVAHKGGNTLTVAASGNKFGHHTDFNCPILVSTKTTLTGANNIWADTGKVVPVQRHD